MTKQKIIRVDDMSALSEYIIDAIEECKAPKKISNNVYVFNSEHNTYELTVSEKEAVFAIKANENSECCNNVVRTFTEAQKGAKGIITSDIQVIKNYQKKAANMCKNVDTEFDGNHIRRMVYKGEDGNVKIKFVFDFGLPNGKTKITCYKQIAG